MLSIQDILQQLKLTSSAEYYNCTIEQLADSFADNVNHLLVLFEHHRLPKNTRSIISIGCGMAEEALALHLYLDPGFTYTGIDIGGDCVILNEEVFSQLTTSKLNFICHDATELFAEKNPCHHVKQGQYYLAMMRHPHLLHTENEQFEPFKIISTSVFPTLPKPITGRIFTTFYTATERDRFIKLYNTGAQLKDLYPLKLCDVYDDPDPKKVYERADPTLDGMMLNVDRFSICRTVGACFLIRHYKNPPVYSTLFQSPSTISPQQHQVMVRQNVPSTKTYTKNITGGP